MYVFGILLRNKTHTPDFVDINECIRRLLGLYCFTAYTNYNFLTFRTSLKAFYDNVRTPSLSHQKQNIIHHKKLKTMKTFLIIAASLALLISTSAFSPKNKALRVATPKIENAFAQEFGEQENVTWSRESNELVLATFVVDKQTANAYFDNEGNYVCSTSEIQKENLPMKLKIAATREFEGGTINAILQMNNPEETAYFFQVTTSKGTKVWKGYANGSIEFFKKLR